MENIWTTENHIVDYCAGFIVIEEVSTGRNFTAQLKSNTGRNITRAQFLNCVKSHGIDRACVTFKKLSGKVQ
tara:strand:- start:4 stop:219 length:216 start_codon:yes stop_codon:yes gene_type:complete